MRIFGISIEVYVIWIILGIPIFFIWRWLFKKLIKSARTRRVAIWIATIITTPILYGIIIAAIIMGISYYPNRGFDQAEWLSNKDKRYEYTKNIIGSHMLIGKTKTEVIKILGEDGSPQQENHWYYSLGHKPRLFNIDPSLLEIMFENGKVVSLREIR